MNPANAHPSVSRLTSTSSATRSNPSSTTSYRWFLRRNGSTCVVEQLVICCTTNPRLFKKLWTTTSHVGGLSKSARNPRDQWRSRLLHRLNIMRMFSICVYYFLWATPSYLNSRAIKHLPAYLRTACLAATEATGWPIFIATGGPTPIANGNLNMQTYVTLASNFL